MLTHALKETREALQLAIDAKDNPYLHLAVQIYYTKAVSMADCALELTK